MRKLTFVSISIYIFCVLYGCAPIYTENFETEAWKEHLLERERLLDRSPTFLEVNGKKDNGKNMKKRRYWVSRDPSTTCGWNPYDCFKKKRESSK